MAELHVFNMALRANFEGNLNTLYFLMLSHIKISYHKYCLFEFMVLNPYLNVSLIDLLPLFTVNNSDLCSNKRKLHYGLKIA